VTTPYPPPAASRPDRTTLYGVLGLVIGLLCCGIVGIVLGYLSIREARQHNASPVLGWVAIVLSVINIVVNGILGATDNSPWFR